ncbi:prepilin peptidase [Olleya sp. HaHaR_3_96]|uniref:prepilin peptidase n=1 Tax=Olleya sp. HaHaR_3_96 TaxID=2745560 RepID=UPI001C4F015E|nr:hypothetical protein H0I26_10765 [Olleya sp. HaHaR_3_96]
MNFIIILSIIILLILVVFQDFKMRQIHVLLPILLLFLSVMINYIFEELSFKDTIYNIGFIAVNIIGLSLYFSIKNKKFINPIDESIGLGDILFFLAITPLFTLKPFIVFFVVSLLLTLLFYSIVNAIKKTSTIPLAGYLSIFLMAFLIIRDVFKIIQTY